MNLPKAISRSRIVLSVLAGFTLAAGAFGIVQGVTHAQAAMVRDNSNNSIIRGGAVTQQEFITKARANNPADLQNIYNSYGLSAAEYDRFQQNAKMGAAHKNGDITVDGQVVARDARSLGRDKKPYSTTRTISGQPYYESRSQDVFAAETIPIMVMFDDRGRYEFGVLTACANPVRATPVTPRQRCDALQKTAVSGQENTYSFTTKASASNGSTISKVVYDFGDGSATETRTSPTEAVTHTYSGTGTYRAKVTVYVKMPGGQETALNSSSCVTSITVKAKPVVRPVVTPPAPTVKPAAFNCTGLRASRPSGSADREYTFTATVKRQNAQFVRAEFDFGDGSAVQPVTPAGTNSTQASTKHVYAEPGTYTIQATTFFTTNDGDQNVTTTTRVSSTGSNTEVRTAGSTTTNPTNNNPTTTTEDSDTCETQITIQEPAVLTGTTPAATPQAPTLPATGVGEFIALFVATSTVGSLGYYMYAKRRLVQQ